MAIYLWDDTPTWVDWVAKALGAAVGLSVAASVLSHRVPVFHPPRPLHHPIHVTARDNGGFYVVATIDGIVNENSQLDCGAAFLSLPMSTAEQLGFHNLQFADGMLNTANGLVPFSKVKIAKITIGDITLTDVDAVVVKGKLSNPLLGMSALNKLEGGFEVKNGVFTLNP